MAMATVVVMVVESAVQSPSSERRLSDGERSTMYQSRTTVCDGDGASAAVNRLCRSVIHGGRLGSGKYCRSDGS